MQSGLARLYNFDFTGSRNLFWQSAKANPADPIPRVMLAAADLFQELDRLGILEGEFFADDKRIAEKKKLKPDPALRDSFYWHLKEAERLAQARLQAAPNDPPSLFAMCAFSGLTTDYTALVERRQLSSLTTAKLAQTYALRLLQADPTFTDAYLTTGFTEYLLGSLPFFVKWFVRFDQAEGNKEKAVRNLETVVASGRYLGPFAKILLAVVHLREKRPEQSVRLLEELSRDYPENPLYKRELQKVKEKVAAASGIGKSSP